jgi:hypothetical protein
MSTNAQPDDLFTNTFNIKYFVNEETDIRSEEKEVHNYFVHIILPA